VTAVLRVRLASGATYTFCADEVHERNGRVRASGRWKRSSGHLSERVDRSWPTGRVVQISYYVATA
jgi:hypothetical protein